MSDPLTPHPQITCFRYFTPQRTQSDPQAPPPPVEPREAKKAEISDCKFNLYSKPNGQFTLRGGEL